MHVKKLPDTMEGVSMKYSLDKKYAVVDHTIVSCSNNTLSLKVPEKIDNIWIKTIGSGAFMDLSKLQYVMLPPKINVIESHAFAGDRDLVSVVLPGTVQHIGESVFLNCPQLSEITIYDYILEEKEYVNLKIHSMRTDDDIYVAHHMPLFGIMRDILQASGVMMAADEIPDHIDRLFYMAQMPDDHGQQLFYRNVNNIGFRRNTSEPITEDQAFLEYLKHLDEEEYNSLADEQNDSYLRTGKIPGCRKTAIFTFDDKETKTMNGKRSISITIRLGFFFFQSACPVRCDGKQYYVYRRYFLTPESNVKFIRKDVAIYTDHGVVMDKKEAQKVYAKYKFLCIL